MTLQLGKTAWFHSPPSLLTQPEEHLHLLQMPFPSNSAFSKTGWFLFE